MLTKNVSFEELQKALEKTNKLFDGNIDFKDIRQVNKNSIRFTLKVKNSKGKGSKKSITYFPFENKVKMRNTANACWHVHGTFFEKLLEINPKAIIKSAGKTITGDGGNWQDWNIGSILFPVYYSDSCLCNRYDD